MQQDEQTLTEARLAKMMRQAADYYRSGSGNSYSDLIPILSAKPAFPVKTSTCSHYIEDLSFCSLPCRKTVCMYAWAAWALMLMSQSGTKSVMFGAHENSWFKLPFFYPFLAYLEPDDTVDELLALLRHSQTDSEERYIWLTPHKYPDSLMESRELKGFQTEFAIDLACDLDEAPGGEVPGSASRQINSPAPLRDLREPTAVNVLAMIQRDGIKMHINYNRTVVDAEAVLRLCCQFEHFIRHLLDVDCRHKPLGDLMGAGPNDLDEIWKWNSRVPREARECVHEIIDQTAETQPYMLAVNAWDGLLTYGQLRELSTRFARLITIRSGWREGAWRAGDRALICFPKSLWAPVIMLAVMKAGGVSTTIDISQPLERLRDIASQVKPTIVLCSDTTKDLASRLCSMAQVVCIDEDFINEADLITESGYLPRVDSKQLLYIVFTSGSTGRPKGAMITHRNFSSCIKHQQTALRFRPKSRVFDFASYAFDVSWSNVILTFAAGACLCIPQAEQARNDLIGEMRRFKVTHTELTPTIARAIMPDELPHMQSIIFSGEALDKADFQHWPDSILLQNGYGPSECTVTATVTLEDLRKADCGTIGHGVGTCTWIVDLEDANKLAPIHAVGELWLEGPLVGNGYLNDPVHTAAAFVQDPPWLLKGSVLYRGRHGVLYRTGDLVRYNTDGSLAFVGRTDTQVKIRGQRVELREIEHHLERVLAADLGPMIIGSASRPSVEVVAEVVKPRGSKTQTLSAFVHVPGPPGASSSRRRSNHEVAVERLPAQTIGKLQQTESKLEEVLPSCMVPRLMIPVTGIPVTSAGKTDRKQLREIGSSMTFNELSSATSIPAGNSPLTSSHPPSTMAPTDGTAQEAKIAETPPDGLTHTLTLTRTAQALLSIWTEHLEIEDPPDAATAVQSNFYHLGGNSALAMRVVEAARRRDVIISVCEVLRYPKLGELATIADRNKAQGGVGGSGTDKA